MAAPIPVHLDHVYASDRTLSPDAVHRNFQTVKQALEAASPALRGKVTATLALATGNNQVRSPVPNPQGRHTVFVDAGVTINDVSVDGDVWTVNASGPCNARFLFF